MNHFSTISSKSNYIFRKSGINLSSRGIALASVMLLLLVITLIGTVGLRMAGQQEKMSSNLKQLTRAQFAAEQAVRESIDLHIWTVDPDPTDTAWS